MSQFKWVYPSRASAMSAYREIEKNAPEIFKKKDKFPYRTQFISYDNLIYGLYKDFDSHVVYINIDLKAISKFEEYFDADRRRALMHSAKASEYITKANLRDAQELLRGLKWALRNHHKYKFLFKEDHHLIAAGYFNFQRKLQKAVYRFQNSIRIQNKFIHVMRTFEK